MSAVIDRLFTDSESFSLPSQVAWVSREQALEMLKIEEAMLRRDQAILSYLEVEGFDYQPRERGFTRQAFMVLWEFRKLVRERGRKKAIAQINQLMESYYAGVRQGSSRSSEAPA